MCIFYAQNKGGTNIPTKRQRTGYFIKCENCGKEIYQTKTQYNRAKHHFCSNTCQKEFQHKKLFEDRKCEVCEKLFHVSKKSTKRFCSTECQKEWQKTIVGELNPKYTRKRIICESCGKEFIDKNYKTQNGQHNFCSNQCRRKWYSTVFSQSDEWKEISRKRAVSILENRQINTNTKPQIIINSLLDEMNIPYMNEKGFKYYVVDNYLNEHNLIIEVMGDFWHCNPIKYSNPNLQEIHRKRLPKDKAKHTYFKNKYDIEILYLWENDIYNNIQLCKLLINNYITHNGIIDDYHSFNYHIEDGELKLNETIIAPFRRSVVNA